MVGTGGGGGREQLGPAWKKGGGPGSESGADLVSPAHSLYLSSSAPGTGSGSLRWGVKNQGRLRAKYALWPGSTGPSVLAHAQWAAEENSPCMFGVCVILTQQAVGRSRVGQTKPKL